MKKNIASRQAHSPRDVARAMSLFSAIRRVMRARFAEDKRFDSSTWLHIETLKFIAENDNPKMKDVARYLSITAPSATSLVGELVKRGFVTSYTDRRDRRTSRLALTRKGKAKLLKIIARGTKILNSLFSELSETEFTAFIGALERIKKAAAE